MIASEGASCATGLSERIRAYGTRERFARGRAVVGGSLRAAPPQDTLALPDFRTLGGAALPAPSADLLDTIYACQQRQDWYRDSTRVMGSSSLPFVGSLTSHGQQIGADVH